MKFSDDFSKAIATSKNTTLEIIDSNKNFNWNWYMLSINPNMTLDFVLNNWDKEWDWLLLSCNNNISWDSIKNNIDLPWHFKYMASSYKINFKIILENQKIFGNYSKFFSVNPSVKIEDINLSMSNNKYEWDWSILSKNFNINLNELDEECLSKIDFMKIGYNRFLTLEFLKKYMSMGKRFNFLDISTNSFEYDCNQFIKRGICLELNIIFKKKLCNDIIYIISDFLI